MRLVTEAAGVREERRELTRRLRRIREEVGRLLPLATGGGGHKKSGPSCLAAVGPERDAESVNTETVARGAATDKTESDYGFDEEEKTKTAGAPPSGRGGPVTAITPPHQPEKALRNTNFAVKEENDGGVS